MPDVGVARGLPALWQGSVARVQGRRLSGGRCLRMRECKRVERRTSSDWTQGRMAREDLQACWGGDEESMGGEKEAGRIQVVRPGRRGNLELVYTARGDSFCPARASPSLPRLLLRRQHIPRCTRVATYDILAAWVRCGCLHISFQTDTHLPCRALQHHLPHPQHSPWTTGLPSRRH